MRGAARRLLAAMAIASVTSATVGCAHRRRSPRPTGPVVVLRDRRVDEGATAMARTIDAHLGGACARRMAIDDGVAGERVARWIAERCVRRAAQLDDDARWKRAGAIARGLVTWARVQAFDDEATRGAIATSLRALAREAIAEGADERAWIRGGVTGAAEDVFAADDAPSGADGDGAAVDRSELLLDAMAFAIVEQLIARAGNVTAVVALVRRAAANDLDSALEFPPFHTDVATLFATARASLLAFHPPRAPHLADVTIDREADGDVLHAHLDRSIAPTALTLDVPHPILLDVCGALLEATVRDADTLVVAFTDADRSRCTEVDGARLVDVIVAPTMESAPRGLDGAFVRRSFVRVVFTPR